MTSPTSRTLAYLRRLGWLPAVVESWVPHVNYRRDLWSFADVLAVHPRDKVFLLVQCTSAGHVADRLAKARARGELLLWLKAGGRFEVHGWTHAGEVKRVAVQADQLDAVLMEGRPRRRRKSRYQQGQLFSHPAGPEIAAE